MSIEVIDLTKLPRQRNVYKFFQHAWSRHLIHAEIAEFSNDGTLHYVCSCGDTLKVTPEARQQLHI